MIGGLQTEGEDVANRKIGCDFYLDPCGHES
jgi:hypothetical protein